MFFIMGAGQDQKVLPFDQIMLCKCCGKFGHIQIIMTYSYFSFFFIPLFKWNRHYYAKMNCCGAVCELSPELGKEIARGNVTSVNENDLIFSPGSSSGRHCLNCGYHTSHNVHIVLKWNKLNSQEVSYMFCPKCGSRMHP